MRREVLAGHAGLPRRAAAGLMDLAIGAGVLVVVSALAIGIGWLPVEDGAALLPAVLEWWSVTAVGWLLLAGAGAAAACWSTVRATPGALLLGCRIVDVRTGSTLRATRAAWRAATLLLTLAPTGLGCLWAVRDARRRMPHDRAAGSVVLHEDESLLSLDELVARL